LAAFWISFMPSRVKLIVVRVMGIARVGVEVLNVPSASADAISTDGVGASAVGGEELRKEPALVLALSLA
jgi:hypothetical protein